MTGDSVTLAGSETETREASGCPARSERAEDKGGVLGEYGLSDEQGNEIIMAARAHWFADEEEPAAAEAPAGEEDAVAESEQ